MAGHSKWKNIQHRKGAQDTRRAKVFTKIARELTVSARAGGSNPDDNPRLRAALTKAKVANMSKENWLKAIKKGTGELEGEQYVEKTYEGYGPGGIAVYIECLTDNPVRTVSDIRYALSRSGGNLGTDGSVNWMFTRKGIIVYAVAKVASFDRLFEIALDHGADDVKEEDGHYEVICQASELLKIKAALDELSSEPDFCEVSMIPQNLVSVEKDKVESIEKLIEALEEYDDVQNVYHNADLPS